MRWFLAAFVFVSLEGFALAAPAWQTVVTYDALQKKTACLMESAQVAVNDGQTMTPVRFLYNGQVFLVTTESNIDLSYPNVGLQVDANSPIPVERIHKNTNIIFAHDAEQIHAQFIRGSKAHLSLGFWPTWPRGDTVIAEFSLAGFTRAHQDFIQCQRTGGVHESAVEGKQP
jgi:hypothetical protein